jgi:hypothetical protein
MALQHDDVKDDGLCAVEAVGRPAFSCVPLRLVGTIELAGQGMGIGCWLPSGSLDIREVGADPHGSLEGVDHRCEALGVAFGDGAAPVAVAEIHGVLHEVGDLAPAALELVDGGIRGESDDGALGEGRAEDPVSRRDRVVTAGEVVRGCRDLVLVQGSPDCLLASAVVFLQPLFKLTLLVPRRAWMSSPLQSSAT